MKGHEHRSSSRPKKQHSQCVRLFGGRPIQFYGQVKNVGRAKGKAACAVKAYDASGTSIGGGMWDIWESKVLKPKSRSLLNGILDVEPGTALYVASVRANC